MTQILASVDDNNRGACLNNVWNSDTLAWEKMEQPLIDNATSNIYLAVDGLETLVTATNTKLDTLNSKDFATQTTLTSIKSTDGIKKITDALPAGTNLLGKVGIDQTTNGTTNKATVQLIDELGAPYGVKHINYKPRVSSMPYLYDIAELNVPNHIAWNKIGYNDTIGTSEETMWSNSSQYVFPTVAGQMEVVSSDNTQDKAGGTGALTVRIGYLKSDYTESSVTLTLNGTAAVPTGASHADIWRINSFRVTTTGTNLSPVGNLTLRGLGGGTTYGYIRLGKTRARSCFYTVPLGYTLYITSIAYSAVGTKYLTFTNHANYDQATSTILQRGLFHPFSEVALLNNSYTKDLLIPTRLPATTDLKVSVIAEAAGSLGTCHLRGWLETA
jgi:hypothetical protein